MQRLETNRAVNSDMGRASRRLCDTCTKIVPAIIIAMLSWGCFGDLFRTDGCIAYRLRALLSANQILNELV